MRPTPRLPPLLTSRLVSLTPTRTHSHLSPALMPTPLTPLTPTQLTVQRHILASRIEELLRDFTALTNHVVSSMELEQLERHGLLPSYLVYVEVAPLAAPQLPCDTP